VRAVLEELVQPLNGADLAKALLALGQQVGLTDDDLRYFKRDKSPTREIDFGD
jgi:hypothetical protein